MSARKISGDDVATLKALWAGDGPTREIGVQLGVKMGVVYGTAKRLGLPPRTHSFARMSTHYHRRRKAEERAVAEEAPVVLTLKSLPAFQGVGNWSWERDLQILQTGGRYAEIAHLAEQWGIPTTRVVARWHLVRAAA